MMKNFINFINLLTNEDIIRILQIQEFIDEFDTVILKKTKITGKSLMLIEKEDFLRDGLAIGPTILIMEFIRKLKEGICN